MNSSDNRSPGRRDYMRQYRQRDKKHHARHEVRCTVEEDQLFQHLAQEHGRSVSEQIKLMALAYSRQERLLTSQEIQFRADRVQEVCRILRGIGVNVNQIAHKVNIDNQSFWKRSYNNIPKILTNIFATLQKTEQQVVQFIQKI